MNIWEEFAQLGASVIDTAGDITGYWGDTLTNQSAAQAAQINAAQARIDLARASFARDQARRDKMQKTVETVVYTALAFAGLSLLFYFMKSLKK